MGEVKLKTSLVVDEEPEGRCKGTCWNETLLVKEEEKRRLSIRILMILMIDEIKKF